MAAEPGPSIAVVLFTDLAGSTAQRATLGEERADELRRIHDRLLAARIEAHAGRVVKGLGDGLMVVFTSASDALTAAVEAQQAVHGHNGRPDALAALSVRMGLSVGDVSWENGECFGTPVVEAARLVAEAEGGQILCSDFVRVMARGRGGHKFSPIGALTLKGLPDPVEACEVHWEPPDDPLAEQLPFPRSLVVRSPLAFVEREDEMAVAERHLESEDGLRVVWLVGEPGIGKTRLAAELARRAYDRGCDVLSGRCDEDLDVPFQPFLAALRDFVGGTPEAILPHRLGRQPAELTRLLPDLAGVVPAPAAAEISDAGAERYRLFEAVRSWLAASATTRPLLVVLDDMQWADSATIALLAYLARNPDAAPLRILGTVRDTEPGIDELRRLLDDLAPAAETIALSGLGTGGVRRLVEAITSAWDGTSLAGQILRETGGNPLFVGAVLGGLEPSGGSGTRPGDVSAAVRRRITRLPPAAQRLLRVASVVGLEFDLRVVSQVLDMSVSEALEASEAAVGAHLAEEVGVNHYRFSHGLVRSALREEISASRAAHYHALVGKALEAVHAGHLDEHLDALAYHFDEAVAAGGPVDRALRYLLAAAERAGLQYASTTAAERYRRALALLEAQQPVDERAVGETLVSLGRAELNAGDFETAAGTLRRAVLQSEAGGFPALAAEAAWRFSEALTYPGLAPDEAVSLLHRALHRLDPADSVVRARALAELALCVRGTAGMEEARPILEESIAMARRVGDGPTLAAALYISGRILTAPEDIGLRLERAAEAYDIASRHRDLPLRDPLASTKVATLLEAGRMADIKAATTEIEHLIEKHATPWLQVHYKVLAGTLALIDGRLDDAEALATAAREAAAQTTGMDAEGVYGLQMFNVRREQGRLGQIAPALKMLVRLGSGAQIWGPGLAAVHAELGDEDATRQALESLVTPVEVPLPFDARRSISLSYLADAAVFVGDTGRAEVLYGAMLPYAEVCVVTYHGACYGPASRYLGMLATTLGRFDEAEAHFEDALIRCESLESPLWAAHARYHCARMLLCRRRPGDTDHAERLARPAQETAARLGMRALEERCSRLLASCLDIIPRA